MATPSSRTRTLVAELPQHQRPQMASAVFDALALAQIAIVEKARRHRTDLRRTGYALPRAMMKGVACATPGGEAMKWIHRALHPNAYPGGADAPYMQTDQPLLGDYRGMVRCAGSLIPVECEARMSASRNAGHAIKKSGP